MKKKNQEQTPSSIERLHRNARLESLVSIDPISRRMFLKSSSGAVLAIPFLTSILSRQAQGAGGPAPQRYVQIFTPNGGVSAPTWFGGGAAPNQQFDLYPGRKGRRQLVSTMTTGDALSPIFSNAFSGLWNSLSLIMGLDSPYPLGHNNMINQGAAVIHRPGANAVNAGFDFADLGIDLEYPSIDQVIANFGGKGLYPSGLGGRRRVSVITSFGSNSYGRSKYMDPGQPIISLGGPNNSSGLFSYLFGTGERTPNSVLYSLINYFWPAGRSLLNQVGAEDRKALEEIFDLFNQAQENYAQESVITGPVTKPANTDLNWTNDTRGFDSLADIISLAIKTDACRVFSLTLGSYQTAYLGSDWHTDSHELYDINTRDAALPRLTAMHKLVSERVIARIGQALNSNHESDGTTTLDNTLIYWMTENRVPHDCNNMPCMLLGKAGGRLRSGYVYDFRDLSRPLNGLDYMGDQQYVGEFLPRLYSTLLYAMGVPRTEYERLRGTKGNAMLQLEKGYGQVLNYTNIGNYAQGLAKIGEPWECMAVEGAVWGDAVIKNSV